MQAETCIYVSVCMTWVWVTERQRKVLIYMVVELRLPNFNHEILLILLMGTFMASVVIIQEGHAAFSSAQQHNSHTSILDTAAVTPTAESGFQSCADGIILACSQPDLTRESGRHGEAESVFVC